MQTFITEAADHLGLDTSNLSFQRAVKLQKGWGPEWKSKIFNKQGAAIDVDSEPLLKSDSILQWAIAKIIQDGGTGHHGNTILGGSHGQCLHWRSGSNRIFANYNRSGTLTLIGIGRHTGSGNSSYSVNLIGGGSTTAETG